MSTVPPAVPSLEEVLNTPPHQLPRNKATEAIHRREVWLQIYLPLTLGAVAVIAACVLALVAGATGHAAATRVWADISLVLVILQVMIVVFPLLVLLVGAWYACTALLRVLPPYLKVAQDYTELAARRTEWALQYVVEPVLKIKAGVAGFDSFIQNVRRFFGK